MNNQTNNSLIKKISLEILDDFHTFCEMNNLKYSLAYGTLLVAIRHNRFIPWDDDIDVMMPRKDYEFLVNKYSSSNGYIIINKLVNKNYYCNFAKIISTDYYCYEKNTNCSIGIWIDIFPVDTIPDDKKMQRRYLKKLKKRVKISDFLYSVINRNSKKKLIHFLQFCLSKIVLKKKYFEYDKKTEKLRTKYLNSIENKTVGIVIDKSFSIFNCNILENLELHSFENKRYYVTFFFDYVLSNLYGDYLQLPKTEDRVSHHDIILSKKSTQTCCYIIGKCNDLIKTTREKIQKNIKSHSEILFYFLDEFDFKKIITLNTGKTHKNIILINSEFNHELDITALNNSTFFLRTKKYVKLRGFSNRIIKITNYKFFINFSAFYMTSSDFFSMFNNALSINNKPDINFLKIFNDFLKETCCTLEIV